MVPPAPRPNEENRPGAGNVATPMGLAVADESNIEDWPTQSITDVVLAPSMAELHQAMEVESPRPTEPVRPTESPRPAPSEPVVRPVTTSIDATIRPWLQTEPAIRPSAQRHAETFAEPAASLGSQRVWLVPSADGLRVVSGQRARPEGAIEAVIVAAAGSIESWLK